MKRKKKSADFLTETFAGQSNWHEIVKGMKSKDLQPRSLHSAMLSFRMQGQIKKELPKQKAEGVHHHQTIVTIKVKGSSFRRDKKYE